MAEPSTQNPSDPAARSPLAVCRERLFAPIDVASLVYYRIAFGLIALWECWRYYDHEWISRYYIQPEFFFKYYGFGWVHPWPGDGMYWHFAAMAVLAAMIVLGVFYRAAAVLYWLAFTYVFLLDQTQYLNHFYLISLLACLMIFVPANRAFSLDAWRKPSLRRDLVPAWGLYMLRAQMVIVYFFAGVAKINEDWLHGWPLRMWLPERSHLPIVGPWFDELWVQMLMSYGGLLLDLLGGFLLLHRRTRLPVFIVFCGFHLMNAQLFGIGVFPWFSIATTLLFFRPDWPRRLLLRVGVGRDAAPMFEPVAPVIRRRALFLLGLYFAVQLALPLRHWLYPGNVAWTEEGHRFAWRMKLRSKTGYVDVLVTHPDTGLTEKIRLSRHLNRRQIRKMSVRPDMLLQFAHFLAEEHEHEGRAPVVRARVVASVNGRGHQPLVDEAVDLARQPRDLFTKDWIEPLTMPRAGSPESRAH